MHFRIRTLALSCALLLPAAAHATNGYWSTGYGPKSKSMSGACVAMSLGTMCAASNPGSLVTVGNRWELGAGLFGPDRGYTADPMPPAPIGGEPIASGHYSSDNDLFVIPHFGMNYMLDDRSSVGVAFGGNGGLNTDYTPNPFANFGAFFGVPTSTSAGIDMMQAFLGVTYSFKANDQHSFGITPVVAAQRIKVKGLEPFQGMSIDPANVTNNGYDYSYGYGLRVGWLGKVHERLTLGAGYQTKLKMTEFDDYRGLLADGGNFDVPANMDLGFAFKITDDVTFSFDYQRIWYSDVPAIGNPADLNFFTLTPDTMLGAPNGLGFGWEDADVYKFGIQWVYSPDWTFRAGYSHNNQIIQGSQALFNVLAPATVTDHYSAGLTHRLTDTMELDLAVTYVPEGKVYGTNPNTGPQTGSIWMSQWEAIAGISVKF